LSVWFASLATDALGVVAPDEGVEALRLCPEDEGDALKLILGLGEEDDALRFGEGLKLARWNVVGGSNGAAPGRGKSLRVLISGSLSFVEKAIEYVSMLRILATGVVDFAFDFVEGEEECVESSVLGLFVRIVKGGIVAFWHVSSAISN
jgi:hypothetical protein